MSEYTEFIILLLRICALVGNLFLGILLFGFSGSKESLKEFLPPEERKTMIEAPFFSLKRMATWMVSRLSHAVLLFALWMAFFFCIPFAFPYPYNEEIFEAVLTNIYGIPLPVVPTLVLLRAGSIHRLRKEMVSKREMVVDE